MISIDDFEDIILSRGVNMEDVIHILYDDFKKFNESNYDSENYGEEYKYRSKDVFMWIDINTYEKREEYEK